MFNDFQTKPMLGTGIYTVPDIAMVLKLPYAKVNRWMNSFWNDRFGQKFGAKYSWDVDNTKAVNFYTLIEFYVFYQLSKAGLKTREILTSHESLSLRFNTPYPFANKSIIERLRTDGKNVIYEKTDGLLFSADKRQQIYLDFIRDFFKNLDFSDDCLAHRLWPLGKSKSIVCDPHHQFGQPIIAGTNILAEMIYDMYKAGDSKKFITYIYGLKLSQVEDAIIYAKKAS